MGEVSDRPETVAGLSRQTFDELTMFRFRTQPPCFEYLSLLIETAILLHTHRGGRIYAGFERLSRMEPIIARSKLPMWLHDISAITSGGAPAPTRRPAMVKLRAVIPPSAFRR